MLSDYVPENAIIVDLEQHHNSRLEEFRAYLGILRTREVWTYSLRNQQWLEQQQIKATYVPVFYHRCLERPIKIHLKTIDVILVGCDVPRRSNILKEIRTSIPGSRVVLVNNLWSNTLDKVIDASKIILHVSQYDHSNIFPVARILPLMANGACVIAEEFTDDEYRYLYPGLVISSMDEIVDKVRFYLEHDEDRQLLIDQAKIHVQSRSMQLPIGDPQIEDVQQMKISFDTKLEQRCVEDPTSGEVSSIDVGSIDVGSIDVEDQHEVTLSCLTSICKWICYEEQHRDVELFEVLADLGTEVRTAWVPTTNRWVPILLGMCFSQQPTEEDIQCWIQEQDPKLAVVESSQYVRIGEPDEVDLCFSVDGSVDTNKVRSLLIVPETQDVSSEWQQVEKVQEYVVYRRKE